MVKPFLKWVGGKTQILDTIFGVFPKNIKNYHEPFLGGGSVLLELLYQIQLGNISIQGNIYASDANSWLIYTYKNLQNKLDELLNELKHIQVEYNACSQDGEGTINRNPETLEQAQENQENYYYWIRKKYNSMRNMEDYRDSCKVSAMFIFLNKMGFRGVYREGPNGYNVPYGHYRTNIFYDETHLREVSQLIQKVRFEAYSFEKAWEKLKEGDFIYLDPPYAPEKITSFVGYTLDGFEGAMHQSLFTKIKALASQNIDFILSNSDVQIVRDAFPQINFDRRIVVCRRAINSKDPSQITSEVLIRPKK